MVERSCIVRWLSFERYVVLVKDMLFCLFCLLTAPLSDWFGKGWKVDDGIIIWLFFETIAFDISIF